ncbi:MAG TPA: hypothetical protein VFM88_10205 [Vicinamibacteria bacterium]|nr:hypothetical protein [Vicinamibacteria bacterium]
MRLPAAAAALALVAAASTARADYKDTYRKALEAVDRKRWAEVAQLMREAIQQNPKEGEKVKLYGLRFETYLPHFHLGIALSQGGDCAGALRALQASDEQGAVRSTPQYAQLVEVQRSCATKVAQAAPPTTRPAPPTTVPVTTVPPTTTLPPAPSTTLAPPTTLRPTVAPPPSTAPPSTPPPPTLPARPGPPPPELVRAAEAYFAGRYLEAVELLDRVSGVTGRAAAQAHLFRAASRFALFRAGGERDGVLKQRALEDVVACRRADPALAPDAEAFSPTFAELFRGGR